MLQSLQRLVGCRIRANDGEFGKVDQFLFDDESWTVRYMVVNTGGWLSRNEVLISPISILHPDWRQGQIEVSLSREQIENSPHIDSHKPVSRQNEQEYFDYYRWPPYWGGAGLWAIGPYGAAIAPTEMAYRDTAARPERNSLNSDQGGPSEEEAHLRSTKEIRSYTIQATNGNFGHIEDFLVDDTNWTIRHLVVDTRNFWPGKWVLLSPDWVAHVSWAHQKIYTDLPKEVIKASPEFHPNLTVDRPYEERLYDYYKRPKYWEAEDGRLTSRSADRSNDRSGDRSETRAPH